MQSYLKRYRIELETIGPVHIGSGETYKKKDYFLSNGKLAILDAAKFISALDGSQLDKYCSFLETDSTMGLQDFLEKHNLSKVAEASLRYKVDNQLSRNRSGSYQYFDVFEFIKDGLGLPYVPGSSLKGMLRTIILGKIICDNEQLYKGIFESAKSFGSIADRLENAAFGLMQHDANATDALNDIMKYVSMSDSEPLATDSLVFVKKYDKFTVNDNGRHKHNMGNLSNPEYYKGNELNIYRECIKPQTIIRCTLTIDPSIDSYLVLDKDWLQNALSQFNDIYNTCFRDCFEGDDNAAGESNVADTRCKYVAQNGLRCRNHVTEGMSFCRLHKDTKANSSQGLFCYLGGGVGYASKTIVNSLFANEQTRLNIISSILYNLFPTEIDKSIYGGLFGAVTDAGFVPKPMSAKYKGAKLTKAKDDHRHWKDDELGASPHTLKLGKIGKELFEMGKCRITVVPLD